MTQLPTEYVQWCTFFWIVKHLAFMVPLPPHSTNTHHPCLSHAVTSLLLILNRPKRIDLRKKRKEKEKDPSVLDCMKKSIISFLFKHVRFKQYFDIGKIWGHSMTT